MRVSIGDIELAYTESGSGQPLLLIHGFPHSRELWRPQLESLRDVARCIAPDLRGFGASRAAPPYSMDRYADDLAALLDALGVERAVTCGLSMGGYIAFALWRRHRERIAGLVLADTRAEADDDEGRGKRDQMIAKARDEGMDAVADGMITGMVGRTTRERNPGLVDSVRRMLAAAPVDGAVGALEAMRDRPDSTALLGGIDVPTLVLVGSEDALTPPKLARAMHERIPDSRFADIEGAGHVSNLEQPAAFNSALRAFLASVA